MAQARPSRRTDGQVPYEIARKLNSPRGVSFVGGMNIAWHCFGSPPETKVRLFMPPGVPNPSHNLFHSPRAASPSTFLFVLHLPLHWLSATAWQKKTTYAMLMPKRRFQIEQEIRARRAAHTAVGLPPDSLE